MSWSDIISTVGKGIEWWNKNGKTVKDVVSTGKEVVGMFKNTNTTATGNQSAYSATSTGMSSTVYQKAFENYCMAVFQAEGGGNPLSPNSNYGEWYMNNAFMLKQEFDNGGMGGMQYM